MNDNPESSPGHPEVNLVDIPQEYMPAGVHGGSFSPETLRMVAAAHIAHRFDHNMEVKAWVLLYLLDACEELGYIKENFPNTYEIMVLRRK
jgi:hypothetical protein